MNLITSVIKKFHITLCKLVLIIKTFNEQIICKQWFKNHPLLAYDLFKTNRICLYNLHIILHEKLAYILVLQ